MKTTLFTLLRNWLHKFQRNTIIFASLTNVLGALISIFHFLFLMEMLRDLKLDW